ncbi:MAG: phosphoenolpyruvate--protein phosphotransferase [Myxococcales bacterium]|nr:phosphoenolpyruvate--protein phosphotransferase [Myxococcales bacterium]
MVSRWTGRGSAPGWAAGPAHVVRSRKRKIARRRVRSAEQRQVELARLTTAIAAVSADLRRTEASLPAQTQTANLASALVTSHHAVLADPLFVGVATTRIVEQGMIAEWALETTVDELRQRFSELSRPEFQGWFRDVEGLAGEILSHLVGGSPKGYLACDPADIVVAHTLTISDVMTLIRHGAAGIVLETGSLTSHVAVLCRSAGLPAVTGVPSLRAHIDADQPMWLNGDTGEVALLTTDERPDIGVMPHPDPAIRPPMASQSVRVRANLDLRFDPIWAKQQGTEGVGLWRTFYQYVGRQQLPTEQELTETYQRVLADFAPSPVAIRLVDLSGPFEQDELPAALRNIGPCRGIRIREKRPEVLLTQLSALVRAAESGQLKILVPFVTEPEEMKWVRGKVAELQRLHGTTAPIAIGAMVEVPALLLCLDELCACADFMAIGSNDLSAHLLAQPRDKPTDQALLHPALLRAIEAVVAAGQRHGVEVSLCGELASDPDATERLLETGLRELSVSPQLAPRVWAQIAALAQGDGAGQKKGSVR